MPPGAQKIGNRQHWFLLYYTLCDLSRNLAPPSQPIRCKTKINLDLVTRVFPRLTPFTCIFFEFSLGPVDTIVLIDRCNNFGFGFTTLNRKAL